MARDLKDFLNAELGEDVCDVYHMDLGKEVCSAVYRGWQQDVGSDKRAGAGNLLIHPSRNSSRLESKLNT